MTTQPTPTRAAALAALLLTLGTGCSGGSGATEARVPTRGEVYAALVAASPLDSDRDGLPDEVEARFRALLGTDPASADSDGDGVDDAAEVFGAGWLYLRTGGAAGALGTAVRAGPADDPAIPHEALTADSDGDEVPDYLEFAGYRFDWAVSGFVLDPAGARTDPTQFSTDQDAYSDGMEVSGIGMDVAVQAPGDDPLVPAYPDISVELTGYTVTLNTPVTTTTGGAIDEGSTWSRSVEQTHAQAFEAGIEVSPKAEIGLNLSFSVETTFKFSSTTTDTSSSAVAVGSSLNRNVNWNEARTTDPTKAAKVKLYLRVRNRGVAPAASVVPTLSLRIGGADIATFEPPNLSVAMLLPGGVFPPDEGVSWVVDEVEPGRELMLTDWELRALESGAPVTIAVAQKRAEVLRLDDRGAWTRVGDVNDYLARILSASADLFVDVGTGPDGEEGQFIHRRVAADDTATAPVVTLRDALALSMGFRQDPDGRYSLELPLRSGAVERVYLRRGEQADPEHPGATIATDDGDWRWVVDPITLARNDVLPGPGLDIDTLLDMRLGPLSRVSLRAPRQVDEPGPGIHSAYAVPSGDGYRIVACVSDYDGIGRVLFVHASGATTPLENDGRGPWFFSIDLDEASAGDLSRAFLRAESTRRQEVPGPDGSTVLEPLRAEVPLTVVYRAVPRAPVFSSATYDPATRVIYVQVRPGSDPVATGDEITSVEVFYDTSATGTPIWKALELDPVANRFEDPYGYTANLAGITVPLSKQRLVAQTSRLLYRAVPLPSLVGIYTSGTGAVLHAEFDYTATDDWLIGLAELEKNDPSLKYFGWYEQTPYVGAAALLDHWKALVSPNFNPALWTSPLGLADVYYRDSQWSCTTFYLGFFHSAVKVAPGDASYLSYDKGAILPLAMAPGVLASSASEYVSTVSQGDVFLFRTSEGRLGKLIVRAVGVSSDWWTDWCGSDVVYDFVVYD